MQQVYKPLPTSKSQMKRAQEAIDRGYSTVKCAKCGASHRTLRKLPFRGSTVYYCEVCIRTAMQQGNDVRDNLVDKEDK